ATLTALIEVNLGATQVTDATPILTHPQLTRVQVPSRVPEAQLAPLRARGVDVQRAGR
ncbi:MAG: hypothetical protein H0T79_20520, partial [Deltaproteobacteria bacterium]|nr:hypothetical protein [Deltaproteobacteria bacterium]